MSEIDYDATMYRRAHKARLAADKAGVELREVRFSKLGHMRMTQERDSCSVYSMASNPETYMGLPIVIEQPGIETSWDRLDVDGNATKPIERPTICFAGIGKLGRWEYFDA